MRKFKRLDECLSTLARSRQRLHRENARAARLSRVEADAAFARLTGLRGRRGRRRLTHHQPTIVSLLSVRYETRKKSTPLPDPMRYMMQPSSLIVDCVVVGEGEVMLVRVFELYGRGWYSRVRDCWQDVRAPEAARPSRGGRL